MFMMLLGDNISKEGWFMFSVVLHSPNIGLLQFSINTHFDTPKYTIAIGRPGIDKASVDNIVDRRILVIVDRDFHLSTKW